MAHSKPVFGMPIGTPTIPVSKKEAKFGHVTVTTGKDSYATYNAALTVGNTELAKENGHLVRTTLGAPVTDSEHLVYAHATHVIGLRDRKKVEKKLKFKGGEFYTKYYVYDNVRGNLEVIVPAGTFAVIRVFADKGGSMWVRSFHERMPADENASKRLTFKATDVGLITVEIRKIGRNGAF